MNETDVVCGCFNVTYKDLTDAVKKGAKSFDKVQEITKAGTGCQDCLASVKELVDEILSKEV